VNLCILFAACGLLNCICKHCCHTILVASLVGSCELVRPARCLDGVEILQDLKRTGRYQEAVKNKPAQAVGERQPN
jgi:hypothetical protein